MMSKLTIFFFLVLQRMCMFSRGKQDDLRKALLDEYFMNRFLDVFLKEVKSKVNVKEDNVNVIFLNCTFSISICKNMKNFRILASTTYVIKISLCSDQLQCEEIETIQGTLNVFQMEETYPRANVFITINLAQFHNKCSKNYLSKL